jgi:ribosome-binding factor A
MAVKRTDRLNSLLKEVIDSIIRKDVKNPNLTTLFNVTRVDISKDLHHAKVYVSVIGSDEEKKDTIDVLQSAAGYIAVRSSKKVVIRHFPDLRFILDDTVEKQMHIETILQDINAERATRSKATEE